MEETDPKLRFLGTTHKGTRKVYLNENDLYVYDFDSTGKCSGWLCSLPAWERNLHKVLDLGSGSE